ncbi:MAG: sulfite exporter TauE/SafE family protein [Nibricoccus sp.]
MEFAGINSPVAAFLAGLTTSLHCVGMCGPLACALSPAGPAAGRTTPQTVNTVYQVSRIAGYMSLGLLVGALGQGPLNAFDGAPLRFGPWLFAIFFLLVAFRLDKRLPRFVWLTRAQFRLQQTFRGRSRLAAAAGLGLATPLLPCAPLYFILTIAAFSGSALRGAEFMLSFALGTLPLLWLAQTHYGWLRSRLAPRTLARAQTALALAAAVIVLWRLRGTFGCAAPTISNLLCGFSSS